MVVKTPTSSLTATELLVNQLWYRTKAKIEWWLSGRTPELPAANPSPIAKLPQELVEMVISNFIYDKDSLLACSMTCYSWYIAAVPYLHNTLTTENGPPLPWIDTKYLWPRPLQKSYELGLLPLVKRFRICMVHNVPGFGPKSLSKRTLCYFSALTNLQELGIDYLYVSDFMPTIQQCFGYFSPTLRFLALKRPFGSCRQILYFIGLFPNLQDLKLDYPFPRGEQESAADATLVPLSIPPLRGRLTLTCFTRVNLVKDMIVLFEGLRFRRMDLFRVKCVRLILDACRETLETLKLYPSDPYANSTALLRHFNLSHNKSLRTLETTAEAIDAADDTASDFFKTVLSSVAPSVPLDIVVIYRDIDISDMPHCSWCKLELARLRYPRREPRDRVAHFQHQSRVFREMHSVRNFRLVLCADVFDCMVEDGINTLERIAKMEEAIGGLDYPRQKPLIISERRTVRTRYTDYNAGDSRVLAIYATAL